MKTLAKPENKMVRAAWAKSRNDGGKPFPLYAHLEDTAAVADHLFVRWLSKSQRDLLALSFGDEETSRRIAVWLAASHDVGKATAAFAMKAPEGRRQMEAVGFHFPEPDPPYADQRAYLHGLAGELAIRRHFDAKTEKRSAVAGLRLAEIVGGHHGAFTATVNRVPTVYQEGLGEPSHWAEVRREFLRRADQIAEISDTDWKIILQTRVPETVQAILNGFLIVCDWIASNEGMFPYEVGDSSSHRAEQGLRKLALSDSWQPSASIELSDYFRDRFRVMNPRPSQRDSHALASTLSEPSLILIEAPTGEGKTETAFACAETLAEKFGMNGVALLLPTRATADAMFGRTLSWLDSRDSNSGAPSRSNANLPSLTLAHSKAEFDDRFQRLANANNATMIFDGEQTPEHSVTANQWFRGRKQRVLSDFVVGTIDQMLFMSLKAKHLTLRHLGFGSKVVIIDEVHAADTFMRTYLLRALQWLGAYQVPVIALSATLPESHRFELLSAYREGARQTVDRAKIIAEPEPDAALAAIANTNGYPVITAAGARFESQRVSAPSGRRNTFELSEASDDDLIDEISRAAASGGCIAVVLNTVNRAQRVFAELQRRHGECVELYHSRFTTSSRARRERHLVDRLGPGRSQRPKSLIVVATQVIESSIDVDFDVMFTDIAPMDSLIQRVGRVHRHDRPPEERPASLQTPRVVLTGGLGLLEGENCPEFDKGVVRVYGEALLIRTVAALRQLATKHLRSPDQIINRQPTVITVPDDVPSLIAQTYSSAPFIPSQWQEHHARAEQVMREEQLDQRQRSNQFVVRQPGVGEISEWSSRAQSEASEEHCNAAQVRDAELSIEVVLVQRVVDQICSLPSLGENFGGLAVDLTAGISDELAKAVATCSVSLPAWMTRGTQLESVISSLERNGIESWQNSPWLRGALPMVLDASFSCTINNIRVQYSEELGLVVEREDSP